jgi:hypothetical protein
MGMANRGQEIELEPKGRPKSKSGKKPGSDWKKDRKKIKK